MKKHSIFAFACLAIFSCNDSDSKTDTTVTSSDTLAVNGTTDTGITTPSTAATMPADSATAKFLVKATEGGLAEVACGQVAQNKSVNESVKMFAGMMVSDHSGVNAQLSMLAGQRQVVLPSETSPENKKMAADVEKKSGAAFDKAYMDMMVAAHKKTIGLFEKASGELSDPAVKTLIEQTLPKVKTHLDSAQAIRKRL
ncbi:MAG: DUF4142 domain-containing protein [Rhizobacter sp.]|nr:DUF4142 domain-containing protein [Ferruginibacter sp.]